MQILIKGATIVNEGNTFNSDLLIEDERIKKIAENIEVDVDKVINAKGKYLIPENHDLSLNHS